MQTEISIDAENAEKERERGGGEQKAKLRDINIYIYIWDNSSKMAEAREISMHFSTKLVFYIVTNCAIIISKSYICS